MLFRSIVRRRSAGFGPRSSTRRSIESRSFPSTLRYPVGLPSSIRSPVVPTPLICGVPLLRSLRPSGAMVDWKSCRERGLERRKGSLPPKPHECDREGTGAGPRCWGAAWHSARPELLRKEEWNSAGWRARSLEELTLSGRYRGQHRPSVNSAAHVVCRPRLPYGHRDDRSPRSSRRRSTNRPH